MTGGVVRMVAFALSGKTRFLASLRNDEEKNEMTAGEGLDLCPMGNNEISRFASK